MFFEMTLRNNHALYYYLLLSKCHKCRRNRELYPEFNLAIRTHPKRLVSSRLLFIERVFLQVSRGLYSSIWCKWNAFCKDMDGYERAKLVGIIPLEFVFAIWSLSNVRSENTSLFIYRFPRIMITGWSAMKDLHTEWHFSLAGSLYICSEPHASTTVISVKLQ
jgi:hypothetical protein